MIYPSVGQYTEAIKLAEQSPEDYFATLTMLRPVLDEDNNPVMSSGNFAVVFKMVDQNDGKFYALKCFTRDQEGRNESYRLIADELQDVSSDYLTKIQYLDKELFVDTNTDDNEFPVLLMDWVEGETLDKYVRKNIGDQYTLSMLAYKFSKLAMWLITQPFAHGDLKPDNILVRKDGSLVLVDYDGMYVPAMKGQKSRELGSPDFRHPLRTEDDFDEHIDDFSLSTILLSLKAISLQPSLLEEYGAADRLLFSERDYREISECKVLDAVKQLMQDSELTTLLSLFLIALTQQDLSQVSSRLFNLKKPKIEDYPDESLSTEVTDEDIANGVEDEFGVVYSRDGNRLLSCKDYCLNEYEVKEGTKVICDWAFVGDYDEKYGFASSLKSIKIPDSVISIGEGAFRGCISLQSIDIPNSVTNLGDIAFRGCKSLQTISLSDNITNIGNDTFAWCMTLQSIIIPFGVTSIGDNAFEWCESLQNIIIPNSITNIGNEAFRHCKLLQNIDLPESVTTIGNWAFQDCRRIQNLTIPNSVTTIGRGFIANSGVHTICCSSSYYDVKDDALYGNYGKCLHTYFGNDVHFQIPNKVTIIGDSAFYGCSTLHSISIPDSVTNIGNGAFCYCKSLQSIDIPNSVTSIGNAVFYNCESLQSIHIPDCLSNIGNEAFSYCKSLQSIHLPNSVASIGNETFRGCESLKSVTIPNGITNIAKGMFQYCKALRTIAIPDCVFDIEDGAFMSCESIQSISIPVSVVSIGCEAFFGCKSLHSIIIPNSVSNISNGAFSCCESLQSIIIPNSVSSIGHRVFSGCDSLRTIVIPNSVLSIGEGAFRSCQSLQSIIIPDSVESVGNEVFNWCKSLQSIIIPQGSRSKFEQLLPNYKDKLVEQ